MYTSSDVANTVTSHGDYDVNRRLLERRIADISNVLPPDSHTPTDRSSPPSYNDVIPGEPPDVSIISHEPSPSRESRTPSRGATPNRTGIDSPPSYNDVIHTEVPSTTSTRNIPQAPQNRHMTDIPGDTPPPTYNDVIPREHSVRPPPTYNNVTTTEVPTVPGNVSSTCDGASENTSPTRVSAGDVQPPRPSTPMVATADAPVTTSGQVSDLRAEKPYKSHHELPISSHLKLPISSHLTVPIS